MGIIFLSLIVVFVIVFYRRDLSESSVQAKYMTEYSDIVNLEIQALDGEVLDIDIH